MKTKVLRIGMAGIAVILALAGFWIYSRERARMQGSEAAAAFEERMWGTEGEQARERTRVMTETLEVWNDSREMLVERLAQLENRPADRYQVERDIEHVDAKIAEAEKALSGVKAE